MNLKIFYPDHCGQTDANSLKAQLAKEVPDAEVSLPP
jgi:hypothetical protein